MGEPVVAVERLSFFFGSKKVLDGVSFQVPAGRFTVLAGPNGVGKTTLLSCLAGFYRPQAGRVTVFGKDPWIEPQVLQRVGLAVEAPYLPSSWTLEAMAAWLCHAGRLSASGRQFLEQASVELGLACNLAFRELSRGQKSLAQLVFALSLEPELLLLDEPFLGLDVAALDRALGVLLVSLPSTPPRSFSPPRSLPSPSVWPRTWSCSRGVRPDGAGRFLISASASRWWKPRRLRRGSPAPGSSTVSRSLPGGLWCWSLPSRRSSRPGFPETAWRPVGRASDRSPRFSGKGKEEPCARFSPAFVFTSARTFGFSASGWPLPSSA